MEDIVFGFYEDCPEGGRGRKEAKRKRGRGGEEKVRGEEEQSFQKLWTGGSSKKKAWSLERKDFSFI